MSTGHGFVDQGAHGGVLQQPVTTLAEPAADNYSRFTGTRQQVEARTPAEVLADIGAASTSHAATHMPGGSDLLNVLKFFNGTFLESFDAVVTSNGTTITMSLEKSGTGDLTMVFNDGETLLDCTPALTIALTAGSDTAPQENFIYIPQSTKVLTKSTSAWPTVEHIKVAYFVVQSASFVQTEGALVNQNWNDHASDTSTSLGHLSHIAERIRAEAAVYHSGVAPTVTITTNAGVPDNVDLALSAGVIYQMHRHAFAALDTAGADNVHVVNDSVTPYDAITDLNVLLTDSAGGSMSNKYFNLVVWAVANKAGTHAPMMINLPSGSYNTQSGAQNDTDGHTNFTMPVAFSIDSSTGFLIARLLFRHQPASGGTWTLVETGDLRGLTPASAVGGGTSLSQTEFADNQFKVFDDSDSTKIMDIQLSGITTANTRTITMADQNVDLTPNTGTFPAAAHAARHMPAGADVLQLSATDKLLGRATAGAGDVEEIALTAAGRALIDDADAAAQRTTLGLGTIATEAETAYLLASGARALTGPWAANNDITGLTKLEVDNLRLNANTLEAIAGNLTIKPAAGSIITLSGATRISLASDDVQIVPGLNTDASLFFAGTSNSGTLLYMEDEDEFRFDALVQATQLKSTGTLQVDGVATITGLATGGLTDYDLKVGDTTTPDYGMIQFGNAVIGRTSYNVGAIDLDGAIMVRNIGGPVTSEIEFIWTESAGNTCRFALPKSAVGNATYNSRSMMLAGPAPADTDFVKVSYWQGQGIFHNLVCDTAGDGADLGVQNDLEVEGDIFVDSVLESTTAAGVTIDSVLLKDGGVGAGIAAPVSLVHIYENTANVDASAGLTIEQDGVGDAVAQFLLTAGRRWVVGIDNSDSDKFKIASTEDVGTGVALALDVLGNLEVNTGGLTGGGAITAYGKVASDTISDVYTLVMDRAAGSGGAGLGVRMLFQLENAAGARHDAVKLEAVWDDATSTSEDAHFEIFTMQAGAFTSCGEFKNASFIPATPIAIAGGGTGQATQQAAIDALTNVSAATNEHVLTKDTASGNAIFKAAPGGGGAHAILDGSTHTDSVAAAVTRGSIIYGNATPKWDELVLGGNAKFLLSDGTDLAWKDIDDLTADGSPVGATDYVMTYDLSAGVHKKVLLDNLPAGSGDVVGPASAVDNQLARFDSTTGKLIQTSQGKIDDAGFLTSLNGITLADARPLQLGAAGVQAELAWDTTGTYDALTLGLNTGGASASGHLSIMQLADVGNVNRRPAASVTNPTLRIYSADAAQADDYVELSHDLTNALVSWGNGILDLAGGDVNVSAGNLGLGQAVPASLLHLEKTGTAKANLDIMRIVNPVNAADMDGTGTSILLRQYYYDAATPAVVDIGRLGVETLTDWTSTGSTQDSLFKLDLNQGGTMTRKMELHARSSDQGVLELFCGVRAQRSGVNTPFQCVDYSNTATHEAQFSIRKARGVYGTPLVVQDGDKIGGLDWRAYLNGSFRTKVEVKAVMNGTISGSNGPMDLAVKVSPAGVGSPVDVMVMDSAGDITFSVSGVRVNFGGTNEYIEQSAGQLLYNTAAGGGGHRFEINGARETDLAVGEWRFWLGASRRGALDWDSTYFNIQHTSSTKIRLSSTYQSIVSRLRVSASHSSADSTVDVDGDLALKDGMTAPGTTAGKAKLYVDSADGDLKIKFGDGTVKTIVTDT